MTPDDLRQSIAVSLSTLNPHLAADWSVRAGTLEWSCRRTLDHMVDVLVLYSSYMATIATGRLPILRDGDPDLSLPDLLTVLQTTGSIMAVVAAYLPPDTRIFHPAGMADVSGYLAMGCEEVLVHAADIASGLAIAFRPPDDLSERVVRRLFPWAPIEGDVWHNLLWATGRIALPDRERLPADWYWQCAPIDEWDGTIKKRSAPPAWTV